MPARIPRQSPKVRLKSEARRRQRHLHLRRRLSGTTNVPRLNVFRSSAHIYAQLIDDVDGKTLAGASTLDKSIRSGKKDSKSKQAEAAGRLLAERAREAGVEQVVFDRGGYLYHGRVKALAEGARAGGLRF